MTVPAAYSLRHAYHFTAINNLPSIIEHGLLATNVKNSRGIAHTDVAEASIQGRRSAMTIPGTNGLSVHDYVPFYFARRTPMQMSVLHKKNVDQQFIIYFSVPVTILDTKPGVLFTDASANTEATPNFYSSDESDKLATLKWITIDNSKWSYPNDDERHQKMAELLVPSPIFISEISQIITWNTSISDMVRSVFQQKGMAAPVVIENPRHYFADPDNWDCSLITGPHFLKRNYLETVAAVCASRRTSVKFSSVESAVQTVRENFNVIKELADISGLKANYGPHHDDVGTHSRRVAELVRQSPEYARLDEHHKAVLEMAAYLHDIGKGPKSRWKDSYMSKADNNHANKSLPMLQRVLTEDIGNLSDESARKIVMLVTYDDLLGDIAAKGRDKNQLFEIVTCQDDIDMLVALSKADIGSLSQVWLNDVSGEIDHLRQEALLRIHNSAP